MYDEYKMLKEEIMLELSIIQNCKTLLYTLVITFLTFSFEKNNSWMFLLPFIAIIPLYNLMTQTGIAEIKTVSNEFGRKQSNFY